jgi:5'-3' exonuclease
MGIVGLGEVIKKKCPQAIKNVANDFEMFRGKRLCFDTSGLMYKMVATCKSIENGDHLKGFVNITRRLQGVGAHPLFVFDGKQTFAKNAENQKRAKVKTKTRQKLQAEIQETKKRIESLQQQQDTSQLSSSSLISDDVVQGDNAPSLCPTGPTGPPGPTPSPVSAQGGEEVTSAEAEMLRLVQIASARGELFKKQDKAKREVKAEYYGQLRELFQKEGIPFVTAEYEAEKTCCLLVMQGHCDIVVSDDYDCLVCGVPFFLQHFNSSTNQPRFIYLQPILDHLKMTHVEFVEYCILLGCDFGGHIENIGPSRALPIIHKYKNINAFLDSPDGKAYRLEEPFNYDVPRSMFLDDSFPLQCGSHTYNLEGEGGIWKKLSEAIQAHCHEHILIPVPGRVSSETPNPLGKREILEDESSEEERERGAERHFRTPGTPGLSPQFSNKRARCVPL